MVIRVPAFLSLSLAFALPAQGDGRQADMTFPKLVNGDGRQRLSEFYGQPVVVVTFADVFGGLAAAGRAIKMAKKHKQARIAVIMSRVPAGSSTGNASAGVDLGAWLMKRYPGVRARVCDKIRPSWDWSGIGRPPLYAVIGPGGRLIDKGTVAKSPKGLKLAIEEAVARTKNGWGDKQSAALRVRLHTKGDLSGAYAMAAEAMRAEVQQAFEAEVRGVRWLMQQGRWTEAARRTHALRKHADRVAAWQAPTSELQRALESESGQRELHLCSKLGRLLKPFASKAPARGDDRRLAAFARSAVGTSVGERARRLAERCAQSAAIR